MAKRKIHHGCTVEEHNLYLRIRFRYLGRRYSRSTNLRDNAENRIKAEKLARLIAATIAAGRDPLPLLAPKIETKSKKHGPTLREYYETWINDKSPPLVRKAQARDYRRHLEKYILPRIGELPVSIITARDILGLRSSLMERGLRGKPLKLKSVKNILVGSLRAMLRDARVVDHLLDHDPFDGVRWPRLPVPGPDPFTAEERARIETWFAKKVTRFRGLAEGQVGGHRMHPSFAAFVHILFWTGMRPSEVIGLTWGDVDLQAGFLRVTRSRYAGEYSAPKTGSAARTVQLLPETVRQLEVVQPLHLEPRSPVFVNTEGKPIHLTTFATWHWNPCLRALGIRARGIYATKDTYISFALTRGVNISWLVGQTGVSYPTMLRHYGTYLRSEGPDQLARLTDGDRSGSPAAQPARPS
jgi:integrase